MLLEDHSYGRRDGQYCVKYLALFTRHVHSRHQRQKVSPERKSFLQGLDLTTATEHSTQENTERGNWGGGGGDEKGRIGGPTVSDNRIV